MTLNHACQVCGTFHDGTACPQHSGTGMDHPLANKHGIAIVIGLLLHKGAMCPKCNYGTRVTSKRWAKCKRCGERVPRRSLDDLPTTIDGAGESA